MKGSGETRLDINAFIDKWSNARGGAERANYQMFLSEFCQAVAVPSPDPASDDTTSNDYVFERGVKRREAEAMASTLRIDLYKRGCFILEAKQSPERLRLAEQANLSGSAAPTADPKSGGKWDVLMRNARRQAEDLWRKMDAPDHADRFFSGFKTHLRYFNGGLFHEARAFPMGREEIGELLAAARHDWRFVEPAIFGTLVEQALDPAERRKLGAHYTPRSYVERLVEVTVMEPLRADWAAAQTKAEDARERSDVTEAVALVRAFHHALCQTRVLDPACGTGNFLYVALELMKRLEGEVLETLAQLGESESIGLETVDPHQFLGIELNVRAAAIAELVLWIGYLQQHYRNRSEHPAEPILKAFGNIQQKDAVLTWDGYPELQFEMREGVAVQVYPNARRPEWPAAEFIVGNPPFIGSKYLRARMPHGYPEALWRSHPYMNESADFVMYWWDRAAELLTRRKTALRRFGLVTTNSISQVFQRRVMERHLNAKAPVSIIFAVPDQPWTKTTKDSAAVRIAMTAAQAGAHLGERQELVAEAGLETDEPLLEFISRNGQINSDLTLGIDVTLAVKLRANEGVCSPGVKLHGSGFIVSRSEAQQLGLGVRPTLENHIRLYRNGRDVTTRPRDSMVIDLFGLSAEQARRRFPEIYQHLTQRVRYDYDENGVPKCDKDGNKTGREWNNRETYRNLWWLFGEPRSDIRPAMENIGRYVVTPVTQKHRFFTFLSSDILPDDALMSQFVDDGMLLGALSSKQYATWFNANSSSLEDRPRFIKSSCFDPFPFPDPDEATKTRLRDLGEELDATRKTVQAEHPDLTLTGLYNVLEKVRAGAPLDAKDEDVKTRGRVLILKDLHDQIDRATADAYGWPHDLTDEQILERLVGLNAERAKEEAAGQVRWLRPDYQIPRFAKGATARSGDLDLGESVVAIDRTLPVFPKDKAEQPLALLAALAASDAPMDAAALARRFKGGGKKIEQRVTQVLGTLVRYGRVVALPGDRFAARRVA